MPIRAFVFSLLAAFLLCQNAWADSASDAPAPKDETPVSAEAAASAQAVEESQEARQARVEACETVWKNILKRMRVTYVSNSGAIQLLSDYLRNFPQLDTPHRIKAQSMLRDIEEAEREGRKVDFPALIKAHPELSPTKFSPTKTEWFAFRGIGGNYGGGGELGFVTLRWKHFVWEILRLGGSAGGPGFSRKGDHGMALHGGTAFGVPFHLGQNGRHEIRLETGLFAGLIGQYRGDVDGEGSYGPFVLFEVSHVYHVREMFAIQWGFELMVPTLMNMNVKAPSLPDPLLAAFIGFRI